MSPRTRTRDPVDEAGMGGIEAVPFGILVLVVGALLVSMAWGVVDAKVTMAAAAREAARSYVEAAVTRAADRALAEQAGRDAGTAVVEGAGRVAASPTFTLRFALGDDGLGYSRCNSVTATATFRQPAFTLPWLGATGPAVFSVAARHTERIDPLRSGVPGEATCNAQRST